MKKCFSLVLGVYAWIGINFVLGRFNHVHNGKNPSRYYFNSICFFLKVHIFSPFFPFNSECATFSLLQGHFLGNGHTVITWCVWLSPLSPVNSTRWGSCSGGACPRQRAAGRAGEKKDCQCLGHGRRVDTDRIRSAQNCKLCFSTAGYYPQPILFLCCLWFLLLTLCSSPSFQPLSFPRLNLFAPFLSRGDDLLSIHHCVSAYSKPAIWLHSRIHGWGHKVIYVETKYSGSLKMVWRYIAGLIYSVCHLCWHGFFFIPHEIQLNIHRHLTM